MIHAEAAPLDCPAVAAAGGLADPGELTVDKTSSRRQMAQPACDVMATSFG